MNEVLVLKVSAAAGETTPGPIIEFDTRIITFNNDDTVTICNENISSSDLFYALEIDDEKIVKLISVKTTGGRTNIENVELRNIVVESNETTSRLQTQKNEFRACVDSENGVDYYVKGTVEYDIYDNTGYLRHTGEHEDECVDASIVGEMKKNVLHERYCEQGHVYTVNYVCPNGCQNGACSR